MASLKNKIYLKSGFLIFLFLHSTLLVGSIKTFGNNPENFLKNKPVLFIENKGQLTDMDGKPVPFVLFNVQAPGINLYITEKGLTYTILKSTDVKNEKEKKIEWNRFDMALNGATIKKENIVTEGASNYFNQYFLGHCPNGIMDVHSYEKITIKNIYPNIDWVLYNSNDKGFKYDFIVHTGGDAKKIKMTYVSKDPVKINEKGELEISNSLGIITEKAPISFLDHKEVFTQFTETHRKNIEINNDAGYESTISFNFPHTTINHLTSDLIIDPQLDWGTFYGVNNMDYPVSIATDLSGNVYVLGNTNSINFPGQFGGGYFQGTNNGGLNELFILKFANNGALLWGTYYGGNGTDDGASVTTDLNGNVFVTGTTTSSNFPLINAGTYFQGSLSGGGWDGYILKFSSMGVRLWTTYYGGQYADFAYSIITDANGNIFVTGFTSSPDFPVYNSGTYFQATNDDDDVFLLKFDNLGNRLWATYYGGSEGERGMAINVDIFGNIFITGHTNSPDLPLINTGGTSYSQPLSPGIFVLEVFIAKFSNSGTLLWGAFYGGDDYDIGYSIITDQSGNVFVAGRTSSSNFPVFNPGGNAYFQSALGATQDAFILKFNNTGTRLWATYYGGNGLETSTSGENMLALDACDNIYLSFDTQSSNLLTKAHCNGGYLDSTFTGTSDAYIIEFNNSGEPQWATYVGGTGDDRFSHIAIDASNNLFFTASVNNANNNATYPILSNGFSYYNGTYYAQLDVLISKFKPSSPSSSMTYNNPGSCQCNGTASIITSGCPPFNYYWSNGTSVLNSTITSNSISGLCPGVYQATVTTHCETFIASVNLANTQTLVATINPIDSIRCSSPTISLTSGSSASTYSWSGPGVVSGATTATAIANVAGSYSLTVTDANGCSSSSTIDIFQSSNTADILAVALGTITCSHPYANLDSYSGTPSVTYTWVPSLANTSSISVTNGGTYTLFVTNPTNGCISSSTLSVTESTNAPITNAYNTTTLTCTVTEATLSGSGIGNYLWTGPNIASGANSSNPIVNAPGIYTLTITDPSNGCTASDTTTVMQQVSMPTVSVNNTDTLTCFTNTVLLTGSGGGNYLWSGPGTIIDGTTNHPTVSQPGVYTLSVTNSQSCTATATIQVIQVLALPTLIVSPNITLLIGEQTTISSPGGSNFTWLPSGEISCLTCTSAVVSPKESISYCAQTSIGSCTTTACVTINIKALCDEDMSYSVPNALSPNGDGINDQFCLKGWENCIKSFYIAIYDRWGEKIYESTSSSFCWDGKYKGKILEPDVFVYYIKAELANNSKITKKGDITLIR